MKLKKKLVITGVATSLMVASFGVGAYAANGSLKLIVDGKIANVAPKVIDGTTYVPVRAAAEMLGATVKYDGKAGTVTITSKGTLTTSNSVTINKVTITLDKVVQDSDSLRLYVTYTNNSDEEVLTADSLAKFIYNGKQYEYDHDFNFERYYNTGAAKAPDSIEPTVSAQSIIYFPPVANVSTINVVLNAGFEDYRFNNVKVGK